MCYEIPNTRSSSPNLYSTGEEGSPRRKPNESSTYCGRQWKYIAGFIAVGAIVLLVLGAISHGGHINLSDIVRKAFTIAGAAVTGIALLATIACCCRCCLESYGEFARSIEKRLQNS